MTGRFRWLALVAGALTLSGASALAEEAIPGRPLLSAAALDERQIVTLAGDTRPEARVAANDRQAVSDGMPLEHIQLQLKRSPAQERAVEAFVNSLTDRASPNYHHWLTAAEFGRRFGVAKSDIARITGWLKAKGMTVNSVYPSQMVIDFSGTAGQVSRAFNTEIHRLDVAGISHVANVRDPRIPAALAPAVEGIVSLHDFHPHSNLMRRRTMQPAGRHADATGRCFSQPCYDLAPGDLATIYNLKPLFAAGYSGRGVVIATVEDSNLHANSDWTTFRNVFQLTTKYPQGKLTVVHPAPSGGKACGNPGVHRDDGEATLDVEWASAAAPSATIELASCANTFATDGVHLAIQNLVNSASPPPIISVSYGLCEVDNGVTANASFNKLYQQAAAEGISVFVATGDAGPTDCASSVANGTTFGIGITGWGATRYNVAVGGTDFRDTFDGTNAVYWTGNTGAPWATAKSYVPEMPWNDTCANAMIASYYTRGSAIPYGSTGFCNSSAGSSFTILGGGEGGPSGCYSGKASIPHVVSGTCKGYPKPTFQQGFLGMPRDQVRDIPDVSLFASDGSAWSHNYATCFTDRGNGGGPCTGNPVTWAGNAGGTSYAAPVMAGIQALVDQYVNKTRGKPLAQGNPLPIYYALAKTEYGTSGNPTCSANKGRAIGSGCIFHDIVSGDIDQDCKGMVDCYRPSGTFGVLSAVSSAYRPAYRATNGYDLATGLGSVNAYNLAIKWPK